MPIAYSYDAAVGLLRTIATGQITEAEAAEYFTNVNTEVWFPAPSLTDVREASPNMSGEEIRRISNHFRQLGLVLRTVPIAVVVSSEVAYGLVRMIGLLLDDVALIHPFRDVDSAMNWLAPHLQSASPASS